MLEHLLGDDETIPPDRGLFLERTWRMHPDVCGFISESSTRGGSPARRACAERTTPFGTGLRFLPVEHEGNRQESELEAAAGRGRGRAAARRPASPAAEILVVAPYNAQVPAPRARPRAACAVGTVDKFQGQEAPSSSTRWRRSSGEDVPRGLEFLLSRNRLNVAISRAQCLAYLVCSPRLLEVHCRTIEQMRLANALCRFVEIAEEQAAAP